MTRHTARISLQYALQGAGDGWATSIMVGTPLCCLVLVLLYGLGW